MLLAGIQVVDTQLVRDAIELARSSSEPFLFNHVMRSWLFAVSIAERVTPTPDSELVALASNALVVAQEPAAGGRGGGRGGGGGRPAPPTMVMKVEWHGTGETGARTGVPDQVPIKQGNVVDPNIELKQYGHGNQVLTANGDLTSVWSGEAEGPFALTFRAKHAGSAHGARYAPSGRCGASTPAAGRSPP